MPYVYIKAESENINLVENVEVLHKGNELVFLFYLRTIILIISFISLFKPGFINTVY